MPNRPASLCTGRPIGYDKNGEDYLKPESNDWSLTVASVFPLSGA